VLLKGRAVQQDQRRANYRHARIQLLSSLAANCRCPIEPLTGPLVVCLRLPNGRFPTFQSSSRARFGHSLSIPRVARSDLSSKRKRGKIPPRARSAHSKAVLRVGELVVLPIRNADAAAGTSKLGGLTWIPDPATPRHRANRAPALAAIGLKQQHAPQVQPNRLHAQRQIPMPRSMPPAGLKSAARSPGATNAGGSLSSRLWRWP
jgi:hypothetical protein